MSSKIFTPQTFMDKHQGFTASVIVVVGLLLIISIGLFCFESAVKSREYAKLPRNKFLAATGFDDCNGDRANGVCWNSTHACEIHVFGNYDSYSLGDCQTIIEVKK